MLNYFLSDTLRSIHWNSKGTVVYEVPPPGEAPEETKMLKTFRYYLTWEREREERRQKFADEEKRRAECIAWERGLFDARQYRWVYYLILPPLQLSPIRHIIMHYLAFYDMTQFLPIIYYNDLRQCAICKGLSQPNIPVWDCCFCLQKVDSKEDRIIVRATLLRAYCGHLFHKDCFKEASCGEKPQASIETFSLQHCRVPSHHAKYAICMKTCGRIKVHAIRGSRMCAKCFHPIHRRQRRCLTWDPSTGYGFLTHINCSHGSVELHPSDDRNLFCFTKDDTRCPLTRRSMPL